MRRFRPNTAIGAHLTTKKTLNLVGLYKLYVLYKVAILIDILPALKDGEDVNP